MLNRRRERAPRCNEASEPLEVLFVISYVVNVAGSQRSMALLAANLPDSVRVTVCAPSEGAAVDEFRALGLRVVVVPPPSPLRVYEHGLLRGGPTRAGWILLAGLLPYWCSMVRVLRRTRPAVVHCHDGRSVLTVGPAARLLGIPVIWHVRAEPGLEDHGTLMAVLSRIATAVIVVADALRPAVKGTARVWRVYNAVDPGDQTENYDPVAPILFRGGRDEDTTVFVSVSTLVPFKGHHHVIHACELIAAARPDVAERVLWLVLGAPSGHEGALYAAHLEGLTARAGVEGMVRWVGWVPDVRNWLRHSGVLVLPTVQDETLMLGDGHSIRARCLEGLPRAVLEAMAAGLPVIASDVAGVRELVVDGETGVVVAPQDPERLAEAMIDAVDRPDRWKAMGRAAEIRAASFSVESMVTGVLAVYDQMARTQDRRRFSRWR